MIEPSARGFTGSLAMALIHRWEPDRLFVILTLYVDESGTHGGSKLMTLGAVGARLDKWVKFDRAWADMLRRYGAPYLHMKELRHGEGPYEGWPEPMKRAITQTAAEIIAENTDFGTSVVLRSQDYRECFVAGEKPRKMRIDTQYGLCFRCYLKWLPEIMLKSRGSSNDVKLNIVVERGHKHAGDLERITSEFKDQAPKHLSSVLKGVTFVDKRECYGVQAADAVAYSTYRREHGDVALLDVPEDATLTTLKRVTGRSSPIIRLHADREFLTKLRAEMVDAVNERLEFGRRKPLDRADVA